MKPIEVAAARGNRGAVETLFPLTSKIDTISTWTVDGILDYTQLETKKQQVLIRNFNYIEGTSKLKLHFRWN